MTDSDELKLSEIFESLQGEGPSAGKPAAFLRLAMCNLHCRWCDTKYTWDFETYDYDREVRSARIDAVAAEIAEYRARRLIVTGGEPLLQQPALARLLGLLADHVIEVETNGTIAPGDALVARVDQWNVSPKLANGGDPEPLRLRRGVLELFRDTERAWLKWVVATEADFAEAESLVSELDWPRERVLFMPEAATRDDLRARSGFVAEAALRRGFGFSSRLHVEIWGGERGR